MSFPPLSDQLKSLVAYATRKGGPSLYRTLYRLSPLAESLALATRDEWEALPLLTRAIIAETPLPERLFGDSRVIDFFRSSSGTSGGTPLFSPRRYVLGDHYSWHREYHPFEHASLTSAVAAPPYREETFLKSIGRKPRVVVFDPREPKLSIRLAKAAGVDSISTLFTPYIPVALRELVAQGLAPHIRFAEFSGEVMTRSLLTMLREALPNAQLFSTYGLGEVDYGPIAVPCRPITGEEPLELYHVNEHLYAELLDPETRAPVPIRAGAEGDLVLSTIPPEPIPFPLIRYHTGDRIRVVAPKCPRHGTWSFQVLGRTHADFARISGGTLRADEIARVLRRFDGMLSDEFRLEYEEGGAPDFQVSATLYVELLQETDLGRLAGEIANLLRVGPQRSYADGVREGLYLPLVCATLPREPAHRKRTRLVRKT